MKQRNHQTCVLAIWLLWLLSVSLVLSETSIELENTIGQRQDDHSTQQCTGQTSTAALHEEPAKARPRFPSGNKVEAITGKRLQELLDGLSSDSKDNSSLVILFHLEGSPHSRAMRPVYECLPAFFPPEVLFVRVSHSEMSLMALMTQGIHALPVLQVNARGRKYRYSGKHWLAPMLQFVAKALDTEPLVSVEAALLCSSSSANTTTTCSTNSTNITTTTASTSSSSSSDVTQACPSSSSSSSSSDDDSTVNAVPSECPAIDPPAAAAAAAAGRHESTVQGGKSGSNNLVSSCQQQQQQQHAACGGWSCPRWDGEATVDELTDQQHGPFFHGCVVFLMCRVIWWMWGVARRRKRVVQGAAAVDRPGIAEAAAADAAAADAEGAADGAANAIDGAAAESAQ